MQMMTVQREQLEADVLIVGAGPAGLSCALHLANLIKKHNEAGGESGASPSSAENIYVLEKGREIGAHQLSGAIMNPKALAELVPDFKTTAPLDTPVTDDAALFFTKNSSVRFPLTPPPFKNKGNYVISLNKLVKWMGGLVEAAGVNLFTQFGGASLIYEGDGIAGVITEDKGVDKNGKPKDNFTPGYELRAKVTVLAEGTRGSLTKQLVEKKNLANINPQTYGLGIKELWDVQPGRIKPGFVAHTLGWPISTDMYGGGWIYGLSNNRVSIGLVVALEYAQPAIRSARSVSNLEDPSVPQENSRRRKAGALRRKIPAVWRLVRHAAKLSRWRPDHRRFRQFPRFAKTQRHSPGDEERHARRGNNFRSAENRRLLVRKLSVPFPQKVEQSYIKKELWEVRNFHQSFQHGLYAGLFQTGLQFISGGRGLIDPMRSHEGYQAYKKLSRADGKRSPERAGTLQRRRQADLRPLDRCLSLRHASRRGSALPPDRARFECLRHEMRRRVRQPLPIFLSRRSLRNGARTPTAENLKINAANCVHCKTCDIADPYQIIDWVVPEGGGGPNYEGM